MTPLAYLKWGGIIALVAALFGTGYHLGGNSERTAAARLRADQLQAAATAYQNQTIALEAAQAKLQKVQDAYNQTPLDPIVPTVARRVFLYATSPSHCDLPQAAGVAGGTQAAAPVTVGPSSIERALGTYIEACAKDARQMSAMIELAP